GSSVGRTLLLLDRGHLIDGQFERRGEQRLGADPVVARADHIGRPHHIGRVDRRKRRQRHHDPQHDDDDEAAVTSRPFPGGGHVHHCPCLAWLSWPPWPPSGPCAPCAAAPSPCP